MITYEKVLLLKNVTLFEKASEMALSDLIAVAEEKLLKVGETLLPASQENNNLYIVLSGLIALQNKKDILQEFNARQMIGETSVFCPGLLGGDLTAKEKTVVLKISAEKLYQMMSLHPTLAYAFLSELSKRARLAEKKE